MATSNECKQNADPLRLVHEGTSQVLRTLPDPALVPVNEHGPEHGMVFADIYSAFLNFYGTNNAVSGDWQAFFGRDVSVRLAVAAVQDVELYRSAVKSYFDFLNNSDNKNQEAALKQHLAYLFSCLGTLAQQLDRLKESLPADIPLKGMLQNRIQTQLAAAYNGLVAYYKTDLALADDPVFAPPHPLVADLSPGLIILGVEASSFGEIYSGRFSKDWIIGSFTEWTDYIEAIAEDASIFGDPAGDAFERINHIATHNLFTAIFDRFLKVYARVVVDAKQALEASLTGRDDHEPHYTLFIAFLRLFERIRAEINTLTGRHLDFYYRDILQFNEKPAEPASVHLTVELAKQAQSHLLEQGVLFKAGKDDLGRDAFFAGDRDFIANRATVAALKTVYRHGDEAVGKGPAADKQQGRLYASPAADSGDGLGAKLTTEDLSWHPFFIKSYKNGELDNIVMPEAELGFAIATHYLWLAEGERTVTVEFNLDQGLSALPAELKNDVVCLLTGEKDWFEKPAATFAKNGDILKLQIQLNGADPAVTPYSEKVHRRGFTTSLPVLLVKLRHRSDNLYIYQQLQQAVIASLKLTVDVTGLRSLAVANDFGTVDLSKPFQPLGARPVNGSSMTIGSKEIFQKNLESASLIIVWQNAPVYYQSETPGTSSSEPMHVLSYLNAGVWSQAETLYSYNEDSYPLDIDRVNHAVDAVDFSENGTYHIGAVHGYFRLVFQGDFGFEQYLQDLTNYLADIAPKPPEHPGAPVPGPVAERLTLDYSAVQTMMLNSAASDTGQHREALFFHLGPFGQAEQHPSANITKKVHLVPQFGFERDHSPKSSEAEFYIGISGLIPPQNLSLLFQVADGTANPLTEKPKQHIHWSYLRSNEWHAFKNDEVEDGTGGLLNSGIIVFAMPADADGANTLLSEGLHWLRAAVESNSDAVCRLQAVAAQSLKATFADKNNDAGFSAKVLEAGSISKPDRPDAAVKKIGQPFPSFGGRGAETPKAFYTRVSERLRHKDRAVALWDYERLILEAFPQIFRVKCLNHTQYEPGFNGDSIYRELAPGHVTIVTIPNQQVHTLRDPLRPYTSLGMLKDIEAFLRKRASCFVKLHVRNPLFEAVRCEFNVRFYTGFDETFYQKALQQAITRFLSPWAFAADAKPSFGGKIRKSVLINFIEEQPYVDYVTDFLLFHDIGGASGTVDINEAEGSTAVSILVSAPAEQHIIGILKPAELETHGEICPCEP